jgi:transposase-like protein
MNNIRLPSIFMLPVPNLSILNLAPAQFSGHPIYKCNLCAKKFTRRSSLSRHFKKHTGERSHSCEVCNKTFNRKDILKQHKKSIKCIIRRIQFVSYDVELSAISSPASSSASTNTDERMSISWLLTDSSDSDNSSAVDGYQISKTPQYYY